MSTIHSQANAPSRPRDNVPSSSQPASVQVRLPAGAGVASPAPVIARPLLGPARLEFVKRWSPALLPPIVGILLLLLALFFSTQHGFAGAPSVSPTILIELLALYFALGLLWGVGLYLATSTPRWLLVVLAGFVSYAVVTASVYWGAVGGVALVVLLATLVAWYGRRRSHEVPSGSATVTTLAGAHFRTLPTGIWMLAPGEHVHHTLEVRPQTLVCGPLEVHLQGEDGRPLVAHAAAMVGFQVAHTSAHRIVLTPDAWATELRALVAATLEQSLEEWARLPWAIPAESAAQQLGAIFRRGLIERAGDLGIRAISVRMQDVALREGDEQPHPTRTNGPRSAQLEPPQEDAVPPRASTIPLLALASRPNVSPTLRPTASNDPTPPPLPDVLDPDALTAAYQAIAERRITDPATIRAIADAFATLARDPLRASEVGFDAESAARILMGHAAKLERQRNQ
jgi:hypothetical protein